MNTQLTDVSSHGAQGVLDGASKASLENEFGTTDEDTCITKILEMGEYQMAAVSLSFSRYLTGWCGPWGGPVGLR